MEHATPEEIKKHARVYITVFITLAILTVVTVAVSYLDLSTVPAVTVALIIASIKATLVAGYFMHLIGEKTIIFSVLALTALFFLLLLLLPVFAV